MSNKFHPLDPRSPNYVPPDALTVDAIQKVFPAWDGNWHTLFERLRAMGRSIPEVNAMTTWRQIHAVFSTNLKPMQAAQNPAHFRTIQQYPAIRSMWSYRSSLTGGIACLRMHGA